MADPDASGPPADARAAAALAAQALELCERSGFDLPAVLLRDVVMCLTDDDGMDA